MLRCAGLQQDELQVQQELQEARAASELQHLLKDIHHEIGAQFPRATQIHVSSGYRSVATPLVSLPQARVNSPLLLVQLKLSQRLSTDEILRMRQGLQVRAGLAALDDVQVEVSAPKGGKSSRVLSGWLELQPHGVGG